MRGNPFSLEGKTILVTGASSGIGRATAVECSGMGAKVVITGRNIERLDETRLLLPSQECISLPADLTNEDDLKGLVDSISGLDGVVLCAGKGMMLPMQFSSRQKFLDVFETNLLSPVEFLRLLTKKKKLNKGASVVAVSSLGGTGTYTVGNGVYGASKAALDSYMKFCARELAPKDIRVNTVRPAMIETPLIHSMAVSEEEHKKVADSYPLKRYGRPEEVAFAIVYLLSDAAAWVTGTSLVIDGGKSLV